MIDITHIAWEQHDVASDLPDDLDYVRRRRFEAAIRRVHKALRRYLRRAQRRIRSRS
ncbi:MAG: hypothetical protein ACXVAC_09465 [Vulcanimicrobiaceae bacterium]